MEATWRVLEKPTGGPSAEPPGAAPSASALKVREEKNGGGAVGTESSPGRLARLQGLQKVGFPATGRLHVAKR